MCHCLFHASQIFEKMFCELKNLPCMKELMYNLLK